MPTGRSMSNIPGTFFEPALLGSLPPQAMQYLTHAIRPGSLIPQQVKVDFSGLIRLQPRKRWLDFTAREEIRCCEGFIFNAHAKLGLFSMTIEDRYEAGSAESQIRLLGLIPVSTKRGVDINRAAASRLVVESLWLPSTFLPAAGAVWSIETGKVHVSIPVHREEIKCHIKLGPNGEVRLMRLERWSNFTDGGRYRMIPYSVHVYAERPFSDYTIPSQIEAFWSTGTDREISFFRATVESASYIF
jgi:hypothetical protein